MKKGQFFLFSVTEYSHGKSVTPRCRGKMIEKVGECGLQDATRLPLVCVFSIFSAPLTFFFSNTEEEKLFFFLIEHRINDHSATGFSLTRKKHRHQQLNTE